MAPNVRKIAELIEKLLRTAGPNSGASTNEKDIAVREALRLFSEHEFVVRPKKEVREPQAAASTVAVKTRPPPWRGVHPDWADVEQDHPRHDPYSSFYQPRGGDPIPASAAAWERSRANRDSYCVDPDCHGAIRGGEEVYARIKGGVVEYLHCNGKYPCGW